MPDCTPRNTAPRTRRQRTFATAVLMLATAASPAALAQGAAAPSPPAAAATGFSIPAQPLDQALNQLARQAGLQLLAPPALLQGVPGRAVQGRLAVDAAVAQLLQGTGLAGRIDGNTLVIERASGASGATLPAITVQAQAPETAAGPVSGYVARRSATATKTDTPILEVPQSISVIGREEMEARGVQDVMEAIRYTPGVTTGMYGPDNRGWEDIMLRGFDGIYGVYRDGLVQSPFGITYYLTEPYGLERVEVLRGPASMAFGQGDAGGLVHRISKAPTGERLREIEVQYGSHERKQLAFDLGDRIGTDTDLSYRLVGLGLDSNDQDRYPDGHKLNRTRTYLAPSLRWQPDASTSLTLFGEYLDNRAAEDPYYFSVNHRLTQVKMGDWSFSGMKQTQGAVGYRLEKRVSDDWTLRQNLRYSHISVQRRALWTDEVSEDERSISRVARTWDDPLRQTSLDTQLQGRLRSGALEHTLLAGVDWNELKGTARRYRGAAPGLDLLTPVYGQSIATPTIPVANYTQATRQVGLYLQDQIKIADRWIVTLGGRQDHVRTVTDDTLNATDTKQADNAFSGRAGLTWLPGGGWAPYAGYTESFLPVSGVDAQNEPYKPSRGKQLELGVKFQPEGTRTLFTAAVFDLRKTNVVTYDPVTFEGRQIGKQRSRGIELEAKGQLAPGLNVSAAYSWLDARVLQSADPDETGKKPALAPDQAVSLWLDRTLGNGFGWGGGMRYIGRRANDEYNTSFESGVTLFDATVHYERGAWRLALNLSNLFDRKYNAICYHGECYQGGVRTATLTARYRF